MRRYDLDNIRWATIWLVVVYHVFYLFNAVGVLGGVGSFSEVQYQDALLYFVYPWFMVLLFAVAGISARYALEQKPVKAFIKARTVKLLVPSTLGLLVFQWLVGWMNVYLGGGLAYMTEVPKPVLYLIFALSGTGPLWFAQMLWLFSLVLALIYKLDRDGLYTLCGRSHPAVVLPLFLLLWAGAQVGNVPVLIFYRFGIYGVAFLLGYFFLSQERTRAWLGKLHLPLLAAALALGVAYVWRYFGQDYTADVYLRSFFTNLYAWAGTLAVLGCGKAWWDKSSALTAYLSRSSYGVYVLHYLFVLLACWGLKTYTALPAAVIYPLAIVLTLAATLGCWELLRRVPVIRFAVLGIQKPKEK